MSAEIIKKSNVMKYQEYIPEEYLDGIMSGELSAIAGFFGDDYAGALVYEDKGERVILRSIYVDPSFRRFEVGTDMFGLLPKGKISLSYEAVDDRVTLEPFFDAMDLEMERIDAPFADFSLKELEEALERVEARKAGEYGVFLDELSPDQEKLAIEWFKEEFDENGLEGDVYAPCSLFYYEHGQVTGAIFLRKAEASDYDIIVHGPFSPPEDILFVDYIFSSSSNKRILPGMMMRVLNRLLSEYKENTRIQGYLMNDDGIALFEHLFGETSVYIPVFVKNC